MKTIFSSLALILVFSSFARTVPINRSDTAKVEQYCTMIATPRILSNKVTIDIDYGEERKNWKDYRLKDEEGRLKKFNSVIDGLNYLGKQGWKLVNAFPVNSASGTQIYYYVFRKEFDIKETE